MLDGTYTYWLVGLSVAIAMSASYAALDITGRVTAAQRGSRLWWLGGGALAMGIGIWAMHYVAMLAFTLPVPVLYHYPTVLLSLLAAVAASGVALFTVSREKMRVKSYLAAAVVMGGGIASMHYIGMAAMRMPAMMEYRWPRVALSVWLAVVISLAALVLAFRVREDERASRRKLASAAIMGTAILLMHYTGMWAVSFHAADVSINSHQTMHVSHLGGAVITIVTLLVLALSTATSLLDRILAAQKAARDAARDGETQFRTLAEAIPQVVWTAKPDGQTDYINKRWYQMMRLRESESLGSNWMDMIHPDDRGVCMEAWRAAIESGKDFEFEYRLRDEQLGYRWYLNRATPMRDTSGMIAKWFGTCTDIDEQKHHQQTLEKEIKERTEQLADANTRLQEEMWERDLARRELDQQNEKMLQDLTARSQRATLLAKMGELLQSCVTRDEVFAAALGFAPKIFPSRRGAVALLNAGRDLAEVVGSWHECQLPVPVFEPNSCWALRTGHPHLVLAGDSTARCAHAAGVDRTYICIPILAQGEAFGILHFQATDENPGLADAELSLKTTFAGQVGLSVANIRLREALRAQSIKDPLTGLYNRRYLNEILEREIRRAARAGQALGLLMLDLDHFKKFNDTYGHEAGDTVLREAAAFLSRSIRVEDIVCRFGGEEFVIILPTADVAAAHVRGERIRSRIRELAVLHQGQSLGVVTVSVGVAQLPIHGATPKELLEAADAALYRAKNEGRDRVVDATPKTIEVEKIAEAAMAKP